MAVKKMTVRDAYAKAKKQGQGKSAPKGALQQRGVKATARPQNPSARNKVGVKPKNKKGPADDIGRFVKGFLGQGVKTAKGIKDVAYSALGGPEVERIVKGKGKKSDYAWTALNVLPVGKIAGATEKAALSGVRAVAENVVESAAKSAAKAGGEKAAKKAGSKAVKAADKATAKAVGKPAAKAAKKAAKSTSRSVSELETELKSLRDNMWKKANIGKPSKNSIMSFEKKEFNLLAQIDKAKAASKTTSKTTSKATSKVASKADDFAKVPRQPERPMSKKSLKKPEPYQPKSTEAVKVSDALKKANDELAAVRKAKDAFKGPKVGGGKMSSGWAELLKKERNAQYKVNTAMKSEQRVGRAAENVKKVGTAQPKVRDTSLGSTTVGKKGTGGVALPEKSRAYSKVERLKRDTANAPLEKNQRYAYEADPMKRAEGKDRFQQREQRRMDRSAKNKERQTKVDAKEKQARVNANWKEVKAKAEKGGPKAQARMERFKKFWNEQGYNLK